MSGYGSGAPYGGPAYEGKRPPPVSPRTSSSRSSSGCGIAILIFVVVLGAIIIGAFHGSGGASSDASADFEDGVFVSSDATRLVQRLEAATKAQGICYGWKIDTDRTFHHTGAMPTAPPVSLSPATRLPAVPTRPSDPGLGIDLGSNLGPGVDLRQYAEWCPKYVIFTADYNWDPVDEVQTLQRYGVESNLTDSPTPADLNTAGITTDTLNKGDVPARLADAISALPMVVTEKSGASTVPEPLSNDPAPGDTVQGNGFPFPLVIGGLMIAGGLLWIVIAAVRSRRRHPNNPEAFHVR